MISNKKREEILRGIQTLQDRIRMDAFSRCMPAGLIEKFFSRDDIEEMVMKREYLIEQGHVFIGFLANTAERIRSTPDIGHKDLELLQTELDESPIKREFLETIVTLDELFAKIPRDKLSKSAIIPPEKRSANG